MTISVMLMVMKRATPRYSVAEAKARLSQLLRESRGRLAVIHKRGHDVAVVLSMAEYERLRERAGVSPRKRWLAELAEWRARTGGIDAKFPPARLTAQHVELE